MKTDFTIDLTRGLADKKQAAVVVKEVQSTIDALVVACQEQEQLLKEQVAMLEDSAVQQETLAKTILDLTSTLKAIHSILGQKSELFKDDEEIKTIMLSLATFVLDSGSIKLGAEGA